MLHSRNENLHSEILTLQDAVSRYTELLEKLKREFEKIFSAVYRNAEFVIIIFPRLKLPAFFFFFKDFKPRG